MSLACQSESIADLDYDDGGPDVRSISPPVRATVLMPRVADSQPIVELAGNGELIRIFDVVGACVILTTALPMLVILSVLLIFESEGPLFFVQNRVGRHGKIFRCLKFRTMHRDADILLTNYLHQSSAARSDWDAKFKLRNDPRITRLGVFVRKFSLDEFPQLINIICGDMSLVGPRPIVEAEIVRYGSSFDHYCRVRPGLTGLWQVSGRNDVEYRRRVSMDRYYAHHVSMIFNIKILLLSVPAVLFARGSS